MSKEENADYKGVMLPLYFFDYTRIKCYNSIKGGVEMIEFTGTGAAFNMGSEENSGYIVDGNRVVVIDCNSNTLKQLVRRKVVGKGSGTDTLSIWITHMHPDHVCGLGNMVFYARMILGLEIEIRCVDSNIEVFLSVQGVPRDMYKFARVECGKEYPEGNMRFKVYKQSHSSNLECTSFRIQRGKDVIYYSGDGKDIPEEIIEEMKINKNMVMYQEVTIYKQASGVHMYIERLESLVEERLRDRVYCMHFDDEETLGVVRDKGFKCTCTNI